ncbi:VOC family protein [Neomicrococcus lactis]|uniref:VOC family protein n=1 Tax=Neomicrococcus lactis TaxID=732241 RepID=UPI002300CCF7|nr:VOC family protein [Neomicrococcus lactis]
MIAGIQVTFDAFHPHELAAWWAETLGWEVEPSNPEFIQKMIAEGQATEEDTVLVNGVLAWKDGAAINPPAGAPGVRILFQLTENVKILKDRIHLDLRLDPNEDLTAVRKRLEERGARLLWKGKQGPHAWWTMADPEGNEFCV